MKDSKELSSITIALMVGTAVFFDVLQWLMAFIFMDWLVGLFAFMTFWLWFKLNGISFMTPKRGATMGVSALIEMIPFLSALPAWIFAVTVIALDTKAKKIVSTAAGQVEDSNSNKK